MDKFITIFTCIGFIICMLIGWFLGKERGYIEACQDFYNGKIKYEFYVNNNGNIKKDKNGNFIWKYKE